MKLILVLSIFSFTSFAQDLSVQSMKDKARLLKAAIYNQHLKDVLESRSKFDESLSMLRLMNYDEKFCKSTAQLARDYKQKYEGMFAVVEPFEKTRAALIGAMENEFLKDHNMSQASAYFLNVVKDTADTYDKFFYEYLDYCIERKGDSKTEK